VICFLGFWEFPFYKKGRRMGTDGDFVVVGLCPTGYLKVVYHFVVVVVVAVVVCSLTH
jgi:hypothetical protein